MTVEIITSKQLGQLTCGKVPCDICGTRYINEDEAEELKLRITKFIQD